MSLSLPVLAPGAQQRPLPALVSLPAAYDSVLFAAMKWREIGPMRGGRSVAGTGSVARPNEYWMGTTGGGVLKTTDGGITWVPVTDKYFGGTIGSIGVAESNPDIVYVGTGEYPIRGNVSHGDGVFKTTDAGKTWSYIGLKETRQISRVLVDAKNPDLVYVAAQGPYWGPNKERGIYKTTDGGKTWRQLLFRNDSTGASDLVIDPSNASVMYAAFWQTYRNSWKLESGGPGGGIFKSVDGGEHWTDLSKNPGLPKGITGNIGITISPANPQRLWSLIEAEDGGVFRSDDGGATWSKTNSARNLRQRAWYYSRVFADPKDANTVYALNTGMYRSIDGGKTFKAIAVPHGDNHHLWIAPNDPKRMIECNDGGCNVSYNGGQSWSEQDYATAQFYHVTTTNDFPYKVCGAQQDNSTVCINSRSQGSVDFKDWEAVGGGESGYIAVRPDSTNIIYAGSYGGLLTRFDSRTKLHSEVNPWPDNPMGYSSEDIKYRFQWTFPIIISPHDPRTIYATANVVFKSTNDGQSWSIISPDLTRHDPKTMGPSGGSITRDQTGVETYATIFAFAESPKEAGVLWSGSDDGIVQISRDGGAHWANVTPKEMGDFSRVSLIEASPHDAGTAYVAANRFGFGDLHPLFFRTTDYGKTWTKIVNGIATDEFARAIRADPVRKGLLYAATERGVWVSFDDGTSWQSLKINLPIVPVHDLAVKNGDLIAATHGRSFWILDDLSPLRQMSAEAASAGAHLFKPRDAYRLQWGGGFGGGDRGAHPVGANPRDGVVVYYAVKEANHPVTLDFLDSKGAVVKSFTSALDSLGMSDSVRADSVKKARADSLKAIGQNAVTPPVAGETPPEEVDFEAQAGRGPRPQRVPNKAGMNSFAWNMRYPDAVRFNNLIMWSAGTTGPIVPPGAYSVRMTIAGQPAQTQPFVILRDPRLRATQADIEAQVALLLKIRDKTSEADNAVREVRDVKFQIHDREKKIAGPPAKEFEAIAPSFEQRMSGVEEDVYQVRNQSSQDPLNFPIKLNNKIAALSGVVSTADGKPTQQSYTVFAELSTKLDAQLVKLKLDIDATVPKLNVILKKAGLSPIVPSTNEHP
ncbi:MAG: glycosyl hydrolase, partial [Gemmatimonadaceae bacterium]